MIDKIKNALFFIMIAAWGSIRKKHIGFMYNTTAYPYKKKWATRKLKTLIIVGLGLLLMGLAVWIVFLLSK
ncbi:MULTISPECIES: hypothetical protein [unclassified Paenibacillus]|uniref:hypothetical protein n=1 Tax=unclassified Paenibacillus TaxID=185978 RepID=UPI002F42A879